MAQVLEQNLKQGPGERLAFRHLSLAILAIPAQGHGASPVAHTFPNVPCFRPRRSGLRRLRTDALYALTPTSTWQPVEIPFTGLKQQWGTTYPWNPKRLVTWMSGERFLSAIFPRSRLRARTTSSWAPTRRARLRSTPRIHDVVVRAASREQQPGVHLPRSVVAGRKALRCQPAP